MNSPAFAANAKGRATRDAENRIAWANGTINYIYGANGERVRKVSGATYDYISDLSGRTITELTSGGPTRTELFAGGRHLATYSGGESETTYFSHPDWLGTERVRSTVTGPACETITSVAFGEPSPLHFTGIQWDIESGLDYFGARFDSTTMGRFMTPDGGANQDPRDPQSWNLYTYVENSAVTRIDLDGRSVSICDANGQNCRSTSDQDYAQAQQEDQYNHAPAFDQLKDSGLLSNITDSDGNVVGTVQYVPDDPKGTPAEGVSPGLLGPGDLVLFSQVRIPSFVGELVGKVFGTILRTGT